MIKKQLKNRWIKELYPEAEEILKFFSGHKPFNKDKLPVTKENKTDLRGFKLIEVLEKKGKRDGYRKESKNIQKIIFKNFDFGLTDLSHSSFHKCKFINSKFTNSRFLDCRFIDCSFLDCNFESCSFAHSTFNTHAFFFSKTKILFKNCRFSLSSFYKSFFVKQIIVDSSFSDCKYGECRYLDSSFENVNFQGNFNVFKVQNNFSSKKLQIKSLDLSKSTIIGTKFINTDLSKISFPQGQPYHFFKNKQLELKKVSEPRNEVEKLLLTLWKSNSSAVDFVDVNWMKEHEKDMGIEFLKRIKE